ncbi:MAG: S49 family peptidase [Planctomycetota bacterium]
MNQRIASVCLAASIAGGAVAQATVGYIELEGAPGDRPLEQAAFLLEAADPTLTDYIATFERIADGNEPVDAVVLRLREPTISLSDALELGQAIEAASASGTPVHVFTENYGPIELVLGAHADEVIAQSGGSVTLPGLYSEEIYLLDALEWLGLTPQFVQIGDYKGAADPFTNREPSEAWEENISRLLDELYAALRAPLLRGRELTDTQLDAAMDHLIFATVSDGMELGLIDRELDRPALDDHLAAVYGDDFVYDDELVIPEGGMGVDLENASFFEVFATLQQVFGEQGRPEPTRDTIAVVHIDGPIMDGRSSSGGLTGSPTVGALTIRKALAEIASEDLIRGVVVRIDSPGGSATASENIYLGLQQVRFEGKPVYGSVGDMAASGGYYIACGTEQLWVNDASIVGSIGVVAGKLAAEEMLGKLNMHVVGRARGPRADLLGSTQWSDDDLDLIRDRMQDVYDLFTERVVGAREGIDLDETAEGRLFAGEAAVERNMADGLGSLRDAVGALADEIGLEPGTFDVRHYPEPPTFAELLEESFGGVHSGDAFRQAAATELGRAAFGDHRWDAVSAHLEALMLLRDHPVVLVSPRALIVR